MRRFFRQLFAPRTPQARRPHPTKHRLQSVLRRQPRLVGLEDRAVPAATLTSAPNVTATGGTTYSFQVNYADADGMDTTTFKASNVTVAGGNGSPVTINAGPTIAGPATSVTVTYTFNVPGGAWSLTNRGSYTIDLVANEVADSLGNFEPAATLGSFMSVYRDGDGKLAVSDATNTFTSDIDDGNYSTGNVTLREAVKMANAIEGADTVHFTGLPNVTITLGGTEIMATGAPVVALANSLTIQGPDPANPGKVVVDGAGLSRVFNLDNTGGNSSTTFVLQNMVIQNGNSASDGANVLVGPNDATTNGVNATFDHVQIITGVSATQGGGIGLGYNPGTIQLVNSTVSGNSALTGGALYMAARGNLVITNSTLDSNFAIGGFGGGGIYFWGDSSSSISITNSTISGNQTDIGGGAIAIYNFTTGTATISNSTLTGNVASTGGAIHTDASFTGSLIVQSTVLGGNTAKTPGAYYYGTDIYRDKAATGAVTISRSFLSKWDEGTFPTVGMDANTKAISGTKATPLMPGLKALANNGGGTNTHLPKTNVELLPGEVSLVDIGYNPLGLSTDQRGLARSFGTTDIGSVELITPGAPTATAILTNISKSGGNLYTFQVKYTDDVAVKLSTIGTGDILVTGPGGYSQVATFVSADSAVDAATITATYTVPANTTGSPNWDNVDNGTYDVNVVLGQVTDTSSVAVPAGSVGAFTVNAPLPAAVANAPSPSLGATSTTFTVTYTGVDTFIDFDSLGADDIRVTGPNLFDQPASLVSAVPGADAASIVATYSLAAPGGAFSVSNRGLYDINVQAGKVLDVDGIAVAAGSLGGFTYGMVVDEVSDVDDGNIAPGKLSIREAINITNGTTAAEVITFDSIAFGSNQTITLNNGVLTVLDSVTITGPGQSKLTIDGNDSVRLFSVQTAGFESVAMSDMTLTKGKAPTAEIGGAILSNNVALTLTSMTISKNTAAGGGGVVIQSSGSFAGSGLTTSSVTFDQNAGEDNVGTSGFYYAGGAIFSRDLGTAPVFLTFNDSTFTGNFTNNTSAAGFIGGAVSNIATGPLTIDNTVFTNNTAKDGWGGGLVHTSTGDVFISDSTFSNNATLTNYGGGLYLDGGTSASKREITNTKFTNNTSVSPGGGMVAMSDGQWKITGSTFTGNKATAGTAGALSISLQASALSTVLIDSSLFNNNSASSSGGAICFAPFVGTNSGVMTIKNTTITGNTGATGGAIRATGGFAGTLNISNSTIAGNTATVTGAGNVGGISRGAGTFNITSTILANNVNSADSTSIDVVGTFASVSYSLVENKGAAVFSVDTQNITGVDPMLNGLAANGGPVQTMSLQAGSPALDKGIANGNLTAANAVTRPQDDSGIPNAPGGDGSDIGAFELPVAVAPPPTATIKIDSGTGQRSMIQSITVTFSEAVVLGANPFTVTRLGTSTIPTPNGAVILSINPAGPGSVFTITFNDPTFAPTVGSAKSLIDGLYSVSLNAADITSQANGQQLDGDGNGTGGDNQNANFHRLFGDINGDGFTDNIDLVAFRLANGSTGPAPPYDAGFDVNGDNFIDNNDLLAFRDRIGDTP